MDAISFVLGVNSRHLRSSNLRDLIYRVEGQAPSNKIKCYVELVMMNDSGKKKKKKVELFLPNTFR
jgi:structural maintenance of chromosome 1